MNSQNQSDFCCPSKKDRKISIFPSNFVQSDPILAVHVNRGLDMSGGKRYNVYLSVVDCFNTSVN
jgi:hypothetical protein